MLMVIADSERKGIEGLKGVSCGESSEACNKKLKDIKTSLQALMAGTVMCVIFNMIHVSCGGPWAQGVPGVGGWWAGLAVQSCSSNVMCK